VKDHEDAFGHMLYDCHRGQRAQEIVENDAGYFDTGSGPLGYFREYAEWAPHEKQAIKLARGRVLDIGCGAGRHAVYLQGKGLEVVGIDQSPLAVKVCRLRGLKQAKVLRATQVSSRQGTFDTILMLGNNFGLFGSFKRARWLLNRFHKLTSDKARIIAESNHPYATKNPWHLKYHELNRKRGRMPGQLRIRVRYQTYVTPWFDYLIVSKPEMKEMLKGTGWQVERFIDSDRSAYIAVIGEGDS